MDIAVYTDGSSRGNPGPGGYGVVLISKSGHYKEISAGFRKTTNNRMELLSVIVALESLKKQGNEVCVFSDSKYVVDAIEKGWLKNWERKGFAKTKNPDLWRRYLRIAPTQNVKFEWVKGHAGNKYNERCDLLAVKAATGKDLKIDEEYEKQNAE